MHLRAAVLLLLLAVCVDEARGVWYEDVLQLANETRVVQHPARRYCDGTASVADSLLYETPSCRTDNVQKPLVNGTATAPLQLFRLRNLSFCCKSNYTAALPVGSNVTAKDEEAKFLYEQAVQGVLLKYDCASFYPFYTCAPCAYAYRSWICAMVFPMACSIDASTVSDDSLGVSWVQRMPMCRDLCWEVLRKCPYTFQFACPSTTQYAAPVAPDAFTNASAIGARGCNPMDLYSYSESAALQQAYATQSSGSRYPSAAHPMVATAVLLLLWLLVTE